MASEPFKGIGRHLRRAAGRPDAEPATDGQLLDRFLGGRDEAAFDTLVRRHGRMVLGVCRRVLGNEHDADDAFQAVFLVLVRKGRGLTGRATLGGWLHQTASLAALKARSGAARRRSRETAAARTDEAAVPPDPPDWLPVLYRELDRLSQKYREPLILCDLEGRARKDVAGQLGIPEGTLSSRLAAGRKRLADRLRRRGVAAPAGLLATAAQTADAVPPALLETTLRSAAVAAGHAAGPISAAVAKLVTEVSHAMFLTKLRFGLLLLPVALLLASAGVVALARPADERPAVRVPDPAKPPSPPPAKSVAKAEAPEAPGTVGPPQSGEPAWKAEFRKAYGLADGQALKLIPGPFPAVRATYMAAEPSPFPSKGREELLIVFTTDGRRTATRNIVLGGYGWQQEQTPRGLEKRLRGRRLYELLEDAFMLTQPLLEADADLLATELYADLVAREGAPLDQVARSLQAELKDKFGIAVTASAREEEREVVVARGKYTHKRRAGALNGVVDVAARPIPETDAYGSYGYDPRGLLRRLGEHIGRPVIDATEPASWKLEVVDPKDIESWKGYRGCRVPRRSRDDIRPADGSGERDAVLRHMAEQTGLTFATEKRKVRVLSVQKAAK